MTTRLDCSWLKTQKAGVGPQGAESCAVTQVQGVLLWRREDLDGQTESPEWAGAVGRPQAVWSGHQWGPRPWGSGD